MILSTRKISTSLRNYQHKIFPCPGSRKCCDHSIESGAPIRTSPTRPITICMLSDPWFVLSLVCVVDLLNLVDSNLVWCLIQRITGPNDICSDFQGVQCYTSEKLAPSPVDFLGALKEAVSVERRMAREGVSKALRDVLGRCVADFNRMVTKKNHKVDTATKNLVMNLPLELFRTCWTPLNYNNNSLYLARLVCNTFPLTASQDPHRRWRPASDPSTLWQISPHIVRSAMVSICFKTKLASPLFKFNQSTC